MYLVGGDAGFAPTRHRWMEGVQSPVYVGEQGHRSSSGKVALARGSGHPAPTIPFSPPPPAEVGCLRLGEVLILRRLIRARPGLRSERKLDGLRRNPLWLLSRAALPGEFSLDMGQAGSDTVFPVAGV